MLLLSGCTALLWGGNKVTEPKTERHIQIQDSVTGVFQYKNLALESGTDFHPVNLATNIVVTPLALTADIVFFPISLSLLQLINGPSPFGH
ncbi:hypothetical protein HV105_17645 [Klebsiella michiganensis]|nr:hypothetical protein HV105_17645 [Klebsiella michiganensis]